MYLLKIILLPVLTLMTGFLFIETNPAPEKHGNQYPEELPGAFTGGFGEDTCHSCHFDYPLNPEDGSLSLSGFPENYKKGKTYTFTITLKRNKLGQAGFQLSSRFENGDQAGSFEANTERVQFTGTKNEIQYLQHSLQGSKLNNQSTHRWQITWKAPEISGAYIVFNIAANAGNGDASAFGDFIFTEEITAKAD